MLGKHQASRGQAQCGYRDIKSWLWDTRACILFFFHKTSPNSPEAVLLL